MTHRTMSERSTSELRPALLCKKKSTVSDSYLLNTFPSIRYGKPRKDTNHNSQINKSVCRYTVGLQAVPNIKVCPDIWYSKILDGLLKELYCIMQLII